MKNSGIAIFDGREPIYIGSIPTSDKNSHGQRLKQIYDFIINLKEKYPPDNLCMEKGFSRFNNSTAAINQVLRVVLLAFHDKTIIAYPPRTVKMVITGEGSASKDQVMSKILETYPSLEFKNNDESDAVAVAMTYLEKEGEAINANSTKK